LHLAPTGDLLEVLQRDYLAMQGMIVGTAPDFNMIVATLSELESLVNY
jgi:hypothetical protein